VFAGEQRARYTDAGLHFIENQQQAMGVAQRTQRAQKVVVGRNDAGFAWIVSSMTATVCSPISDCRSEVI
jgi:hypothetical protein